MPDDLPYRDKILALIRRIPPGRVATYGQIAALAGKPRAPRQVGNVLSGLKPADGEIPWHRVINAKGGISPRPSLHWELQQGMLEAEGVEFDQAGCCDLKRFRWEGR